MTEKCSQKPKQILYFIIFRTSLSIFFLSRAKYSPIRILQYFCAFIFPIQVTNCLKHENIKYTENLDSKFIYCQHSSKNEITNS